MKQWFILLSIDLTRLLDISHSCIFRCIRDLQPRATAATPPSPTSSQPRSESLRRFGSLDDKYRRPVSDMEHFPTSSDLGEKNNFIIKKHFCIRKIY